MESGTGIESGIGSGRSSRMSEELLSTSENFCDVPSVDSLGTRTESERTGEVSGWSRKVTLLSAQLINGLCRVSQSSPRTAGNSISSLVNKNLI